MIATIIRFALVQRLMMLLLAAGLTVGGLWSFGALPIDAFPDISSPQVLVIVTAPGMSPAEVEQRITFPIEMEMQGLPRQTVLRSTTKYALSSIVIDFEDGTDIYWARQQVNERLNQIWSQMPAGVEGGLGPISTPLSEIYMYRISGKNVSNRDLRGIQDWIIRPRLRTVEGVADVNSLGGEVRVFEVAVDPQKLLRYGLGLDEVEVALQKNNRNAGGDRINREQEILLVRTVGNLQNIEDLRRVTIATRNGLPVRIADVAQVTIGSLTRYGGVTADAQGEVVTGLVLLRRGENSRATVAGVKRELTALKSVLPPGIEISAFYDRSELIAQAVWTVEKALSEAVILVLLVLVIMLGNLRSALTVALILPLSVLTTVILMRVFDVSANLMSLGGLAIAIGILVDAAVVVVENIHTQLQRAPPGVNPLHLIYRATLEVATPVISGILIIITVFLPLFSLTGLEGKMFKPLAVTISLAMLSSLILSLTLIPVVASFLMKRPRPETTPDEGRLLKTLKFLYLPVMSWALHYRKLAVGGALIALAGALALFPYIGKEFMPVMDEGMTVVIIEKNPSISLEHSLALDAGFHKAMMELPEVTGVVSRTGADELRLDPMGLYQTDNFILTRPRDQWQVSLSQFQENLRKKLEQFPGIELAFTQPIDMRVSEMLTGVRAAMAVKLYGDDLKVLETLSQQIETLITKIPGAVDVFRMPLSGQNYLEITIKQDMISRYGIATETINHLIETAVSGRVVTQIIEANRPVGVLLRYPAAARNTPAAIGALLVETPNGNRIALNRLADIKAVDGPVQITREFARRQVVIQANVENRDMVGFVAEVRATIERQVPLPQGYYLTFGGQFENQQRAAARLTLVVPAAIVLIFLMLFSTFRSLRQAGLIILNIPFALIGGVVSLYFSGLYLSVSASVGFITLFGVAVLNGVVMVTYFNQLREKGYSVVEAVKEGALRRLRPVLMTALIASIGLVPMLLASGPGSEIQRPLAVVVIGGLLTSTLLTLVLLPTLYTWLEDRGLRTPTQT